MTNKNIYAALTLLAMREEVELPFEEITESHTKEECYQLVRGIHDAMLKAGVGPYTLLQFKERSNGIARSGGEWAEYYKLCCEYVEHHLMRGGKSAGRFLPQKRGNELPW